MPGSDLGWVTARIGASIVAPPGVASLALRRNPRRAHLLVSSLLGKHIPVAARDVLGAADALGALVAAVLTQRPMVVGFAETATALGHGVARALSARGLLTPYAHTTRRVLPAGLAALRFDEEHSHAVEQLLAVADPTLIEGPQTPVVLVDDELSTGRTAVNAIRVLQQRWPRRSYVLATLLDVRSTEQRLCTAAQVRDLGADLVDVSLFQGEVELPTDLLVRAAHLVSSRPAPPAVRRRRGPPAVRRDWELTLPSSTPLTGAHGWDVGAEAGLQAAVELAAATLRPLLEGSRLCLGDEEFMYTAQLLAAELGGDVATSATTRSPVLVVDEPGYPVRTVLRFPACEDSLRVAFAYNVTASSNGDRGPAPGFDAIVLVLDRPPAPHARAGLIAKLAEAADVSLDVVVVRAGPAAHAGFRRGGGR